MLKLYIAVLDKVPDHMVPVLVAHAVLGAHLEWTKDDFHSENEAYYDWLKDSFRKVVLKVNTPEYNKIAALNNTFLAHESSVLEGSKTCVVVSLRLEYPNVIKFAKMWKPSEA